MHNLSTTRTIYRIRRHSHINDRSHSVDVSNENSDFCYGKRQYQGPQRFSIFRRYFEETEEGDDVISGDCLQQTWRTYISSIAYNISRSIQDFTYHTTFHIAYNISRRIG